MNSSSFEKQEVEFYILMYFDFFMIVIFSVTIFSCNCKHNYTIKIKETYLCNVFEFYISLIFCSVPRDMGLWSARRLREALEVIAKSTGSAKQGPPIPEDHRRDQDPSRFWAK